MALKPETGSEWASDACWIVKLVSESKTIVKQLFGANFQYQNMSLYAS